MSHGKLLGTEGPLYKKRNRHFVGEDGVDLAPAAEQSEQTVWSPQFRKGCRLLGLGKEPMKRQIAKGFLFR
jgi:hypothetical protein